jgi:hypothetical protein
MLSKSTPGPPVSPPPARGLPQSVLGARSLSLIPLSRDLTFNAASSLRNRSIPENERREPLLTESVECVLTRNPGMISALAQAMHPHSRLERVIVEYCDTTDKIQEGYSLREDRNCWSSSSRRIRDSCACFRWKFAGFRDYPTLRSDFSRARVQSTA